MKIEPVEDNEGYKTRLLSLCNQMQVILGALVKLSSEYPLVGKSAELGDVLSNN